MAIYALSLRTSSGTIATAAWEARAGASVAPKIKELGISINAATASVFGLGRPATAGTATSPTTFLNEEVASGAVSATTSAVTWSGAPTVPANFLRRVSTPATIGAGVVWSFPRGLELPGAGTVVLWNITATSVADVWATIDE